MKGSNNSHNYELANHSYPFQTLLRPQERTNKNAMFSTQRSAFMWGTCCHQNSKGQDQRSLGSFYLPNGMSAFVAAVYDGHGAADFASQFGSELIPDRLIQGLWDLPPSVLTLAASGLNTKEAENARYQVSSALSRAYIRTDKEWTSIDDTRSGSTVCLCVELESTANNPEFTQLGIKPACQIDSAPELFFLNSGDSRAMCGSLFANPRQSRNMATTSKSNNDSYEQITLDHDGQKNIFEITRANRNGATFDRTNRMFPEKTLSWWSFMLTRSFGNGFAKYKCMICDPDIYRKPAYSAKIYELLQTVGRPCVQMPQSSLTKQDSTTETQTEKKYNEMIVQQTLAKPRNYSVGVANMFTDKKNSDVTMVNYIRDFMAVENMTTDEKQRNARYHIDVDNQSGSSVSYMNTDIADHSLYYDLGQGTIDLGGSSAPVDYIVIATDGVWAAIENVSVHEIVLTCIRYFVKTGDINYVNPSLIAAQISAKVTQYIKKQADSGYDIYKDDVTVIVGIRKRSVFQQYVPTPSYNHKSNHETKVLLPSDVEKRVLTKLDAWYKDICDKFELEIGKIKAIDYENARRRFMYSKDNLNFDHVSNMYRFTIEADKYIRSLHKEYHAKAVQWVRKYHETRQIMYDNYDKAEKLLQNYIEKQNLQL